MSQERSPVAAPAQPVLAQQVPVAQQPQPPMVPAMATAPPGTMFAPQPTASLYVGELDPSVSEAFLFEMFNVIGPVASVRVCRDAVTRRSLGYAYVNFHMVQDGERALEQLNYTPIKGRPCRIMWSQRDPSIRKSGNGNIFIKNLDPSIDNKALHDTFSAFGKILSCKVAVRDGQSLGYGFVHYETKEAAESAIKAVNGMLLNDKAVYVGYHVPRKVREAEAAAVRAQFTNLFIKNLPEDMEQKEFEELFIEFGPIVSVALQLDEEGKSKGFGFVNFETHDAAKAAVDALHDREIRGKVIYCQRAQKKNEREDELRRQYEAARQERLQKYQGNNVYIKNLDDEVDDEKLRSEFSVFGTITSAKIMYDEKNNSRGFGFVCFSSPDEATKAVTEMNGKMIGSKPLYVALAQRKDQRRAQLEAQHAQRAHMPQHFRMGAPGAPASMLPPGAIYPGQPMYFQAGPQRGFYPSGPQAGQHVRPRWGQPGAPGVLPPGGMPYGMPQFPGNPMGGPGLPGGPVMGPQGGQGAGPQQNGGPHVRSGRGRGGHQMRGAGQQRMPRGQHANSHGFKYTSNARNTQPGQHQHGQMPIISQGDHKPTEASTEENASEAPALPPTLTLAALAAADPDQQKQLLGEALFPLIYAKEEELAPKITGMLLEMDAPEVLHLLESPEDLAAKIREAAALVRKHLEESNE